MSAAEAMVVAVVAVDATVVVEGEAALQAAAASAVVESAVEAPGEAARVAEEREARGEAGKAVAAQVGEVTAPAAAGWAAADSAGMAYSVEKRFVRERCSLSLRNGSPRRLALRACSIPCNTLWH